MTLSAIAGAVALLPNEERRLYSILADAPERVFTKAELLPKVVLDPSRRTTRVLDSAAVRLRRALTDAGAPGQPQNVWGVGYRLRAPAPEETS